MEKEKLRKNKYVDERINAQIHENSFKTLMILVILLIGNIFVSIIFTKNIVQCISSAIILIIGSCYFTFKNIKNGIFGVIGSIQAKRGNLILRALRISAAGSIIKLLSDMVYNLIKIDKPLSYKHIAIDCLSMFLVSYIFLYGFIKISSKFKEE